MSTLVLGIILLVSMLIMFALNVPIAVSIASSATIVTVLSGIDLIRMPQTMFSGMNSFTLLAIPYFIYAGVLMEHGGISRKLVDFAYTCVAHLKGGLAHVSILACMFFAAISGSSIATTAAIGGIMIPDMKKKGYDAPFSAAVQAAGGITGVMIPPSMTMVMYGAAAGASIGTLFIAGIIPGIMVGCSLMLVSYFIAKKKGYPTGPKSTWKQRAIAFGNAFLAMLMPVIILGGIYSGVFTPTEAAVVAVMYGFFISTVVYKQMNWKKIRQTTRAAAMSTCTIGLVLGVAMFFSNWLTIARIPQLLSEAIGNSGMGLYMTLLIINILLLILGCFMDTGAALIICTPILAPIVGAMGMDLVHFGIVMVVNLAIGLITPPLGVSMYVAANIAGVPFEKIVRPITAFCFMAIVDLFIITYVPVIVLGLPQVLGLM